MKKTSVYLRDDEVARLARFAQVERISQAEVIRRAIARYVPEAEARVFTVKGAGEGDGSAVATLDDGALLTGFGE
jgi:predicted transcriptional regulator